MNTKSRRIILRFSILIVGLIVLSSVTGLFSNDFYGQERPGWQMQAIGQDYVNLWIAPLLLIMTIMVYNESSYGISLWTGTIFYLAYTYTIYCFDVHFNMLFLVYCAILGLCLYSLVFVFSRGISAPKPSSAHNWVSRLTGIFFIIVSLGFGSLWLSDVIPATITHSLPVSVADASLPTNPVHVIDLAVVLPAILLTGISLLRRKRPGLLFAPIFLTMFVLMDITIAVLNSIMAREGLTADTSVTAVMVALASISLILLVMSLKNTSPSAEMDYSILTESRGK